MASTDTHITSETILQHLQRGPIRGSVVKAACQWLRLSQVAAAERLQTTVEHLQAVEDGADALSHDAARRLVELVTTALATLSRAELRAWREHMGLSQSELADLARRQRRTLARIEDGVFAISPDLAELTHRLLTDHKNAVQGLVDELNAQKATDPTPLQLVTYAGDEDLRAARAQLSQHPGDAAEVAAEDAETSLLRMAPTASWHRSVSAAAALSVGARLTYGTPAVP